MFWDWSNLCFQHFCFIFQKCLKGKTEKHLVNFNKSFFLALNFLSETIAENSRPEWWKWQTEKRVSDVFEKKNFSLFLRVLLILPLLFHSADQTWSLAKKLKCRVQVEYVLGLVEFVFPAFFCGILRSLLRWKEKLRNTLSISTSIFVFWTLNFLSKIVAEKCLQIRPLFFVTKCLARMMRMTNRKESLGCLWKKKHFFISPSFAHSAVFISFRGPNLIIGEKVEMWGTSRICFGTGRICVWLFPALHALSALFEFERKNWEAPCQFQQKFFLTLNFLSETIAENSQPEDENDRQKACFGYLWEKNVFFVSASFAHSALFVSFRGPNLIIGEKFEM